MYEKKGITPSVFISLPHLARHSRSGFLMNFEHTIVPTFVKTPKRLLRQMQCRTGVKRRWGGGVVEWRVMIKEPQKPSSLYLEITIYVMHYYRLDEELRIRLI